MTEERKEEIRNLLDTSIGVDVIVSVPELKERYHTFLTEKKGPQNILFYEDVVAFKEECEDKTFDEVKDLAIVIVNKYMRQGHDLEINISTDLREVVYEQLGLDPSSYSGETEDDYDDDDLDDLLFDLNVDERKDDVEITVDILKAVFDESFREIIKLNITNFIGLFKQEMKDAPWLRDERLLFWIYNGFSSFRSIRKQLKVAEVQLKYFYEFLDIKRELVASILKVLGKDYQYREQAKNLVNNDLIQMKFPELAHVGATLDACFLGRRNAHMICFGEPPNYYEQELKQFRLLKERFSETKKSIKILSEVNYRKVCKKYQAIVSAQRQNKPKSKQKKAYDALKKLEDKQRKAMGEAFATIERLDKEKVILIQKTCGSMRLHEKEFLSKLEVVAKNFYLRMNPKNSRGAATVMNVNNAVKHFMFRNRSDLKLDKIDPLASKVDFSNNSFEFFYNVVEDFRSMVEEYIRSDYRRVNDLFGTYLEYQKQFVSLTRKMEDGLMKAMEVKDRNELSKLSTYLVDTVTDYGAFYRFEDSKEALVEREAKAEKELETLFKKLLSIKQNVKDRMLETDQLAYEKLYDKYLDATTRDVSVLDYRLAKESSAKFALQIAKNPEDVADLIVRKEKADARVVKLAPRVKRFEKIRSDLLKRKQELLGKTFKQIVDPCLEALRYFNRNFELNNIEAVTPKWQRLIDLTPLDARECIQWVADKSISKVDDVIEKAAN